MIFAANLQAIIIPQMLSTGGEADLWPVKRGTGWSPFSIKIGYIGDKVLGENLVTPG